jgi:hypothetical protein
MCSGQSNAVADIVLNVDCETRDTSGVVLVHADGASFVDFYLSL